MIVMKVYFICFVMYHVHVEYDIEVDVLDEHWYCGYLLNRSMFVY